MGLLAERRGAMWRWGAGVLLGVAAALVGIAIGVFLGGRSAGPVAVAAPASTSTSTTEPLPASTTVPVPPPANAARTAVGRPDPGAVPGLLTFRGNQTRSYYGDGPVPRNPSVVWRFPDGAMCSPSVDRGEETLWCGTGWTGQPAVVERSGRTWVVVGAFDRSVHFVDAETGRRILPDFPTGDLVKGSVTIDPDGYPLVYFGSRDDNFRVVAMDRAVPTELWRLNAGDVSPVVWNDDWDGSALVMGDYLFEGGENSQWHVVKLNRTIGPDGLVAVKPELVFNAPGWDTELVAESGGYEFSIEGSIARWGDVVYFANSAGLVQGWDVGGLADGVTPSRVFRFWTGDDTDASVVIDDDGMLYVASEWERHSARAGEVGQVVKLDPRRPNPVVWSIAVRDAAVSGVWATPAIYRDVVIVATNEGKVMGIDRRSGAVLWTKTLPGPTWQSPVVVDGVLLQGDCAGVLHAYDLSDTRVDPPELWTVRLGGCIESTPAVWKGRIYVGTRGGFLYGIGDA